MKNFHYCLSIFKRELSSYFNSPIAYIFIVVFVMLSAGMFMTQFFLIGNADMRAFFNLLPLILCVFIPAITMRLWAEEKRGNTFEMLLTLPMPTHKLVLGKFSAGFAFYAMALAGTLFIPMMLFMMGKPDMGPILGGYLGALFMGAFFLSIGIFVSGLCKDQIVSFIIAMMACFFFYLSGLDFMAGLVDGWVPGVGSFLKENFGMTRHMSGFEKGVIDNRDILYFVVMTGIFLVLNGFAIEDRMRPKAKVFFTGTAVVCIAISMVVNSLFSDIPLGRFDLTEGQLYTVTDSTRTILQSLKTPVTAKLYISPQEKMPTTFKTLEQDIKDRLEEIKVLAGGNFQYKIYHMEVAEKAAEDETKEESLEEKLQQKGISPFQVQSIEQDELGIKLVYSGIAIAYKEKEEKIIPNVVPNNLHELEYELMSKIYRMTLDKTPRVALVAPYTEKAVDPQMMAFLRQFGQALPEQYRDDKFNILDAILRYEDYDVQRIRLTEKEPLPEDLDTLIVVAPEMLNERQRYEMNRFLHEGGNVIVAAQGYEYDYNPSGGRGVSIIPRKINSGVNEWLKAYGVTLSDQLLMDEQHETISISGGQNLGPFSMSMPVKAPMHVKINQETMNQDVSITSRLSSLFYLWGSALTLDKNTMDNLKLKATTLLTSSSKSWLVPYQTGPLNRRDMMRSPSGDHSVQPLAVLLEGQFPDSFAEADRPAWPKTPSAGALDQEVTEDTEPPAQSLNPRHGKLFVVGCFKMFEEDIIQNGGILNLFINSVDALTLGGELINIRSRQPIDRSMKKLSKGQKLWYRFLTILSVPCLVIILGTMRAVLRRKEKELYVKAHSRPS